MMRAEREILTDIQNFKDLYMHLVLEVKELKRAQDLALSKLRQCNDELAGLDWLEDEE
jgi:hypothetical protein